MSLKHYIIAFSFSLVSLMGLAQCKGFAKKNCLPEMKPYLSNGQIHSTQLYAGEKARVYLSLSKGLSYRLIVCADESLGALEYELTNEFGKQFKKDSLSGLNAITDLKVKQSGTYQLNIQVPKSKNATKKNISGCVAVLIGFKY